MEPKISIQGQNLKQKKRWPRTFSFVKSALYNSKKLLSLVRNGGPLEKLKTVPQEK